jgi:integrase
MNLTAKTVAALKLPAGKIDTVAFDDRVPGFGIRLREGGSRTWIFQYALGAKQRRVTIGQVSAIPAEKARQVASDLHAKVRLGGDPQAEKAKNALAASLSFKAVADQYLIRQKTELRPRSYVETERHLLKNAKRLHGLPVSSVDRRAVASLLTGLAASSGAVTANRARAQLSAMFVWALKEGLVDNNPVAHTNKLAERSRNRVLTDAEIRTLWNALEDDHYGNILRLLLLTGSRANEIAGLRWQEIDFDKDLITLPAERVKNARVHLVPLAPAVVDILRAQPRTDDGLVFGYRGKPFASWTHGKNLLDACILEAVDAPLPDWTPHDLRRTCATRMAELGVQPHIVEAVLNHVSGHKHGVAGIYNHAVYAAEKAQALAMWADHIAAITTGTKRRVVAFGRR